MTSHPIVIDAIPGKVCCASCRRTGEKQWGLATGAMRHRVGVYSEQIVWTKDGKAVIGQYCRRCNANLDNAEFILADPNINMDTQIVRHVESSGAPVRALPPAPSPDTAPARTATRASKWGAAIEQCLKLKRDESCEIAIPADMDLARAANNFRRILSQNTRTCRTKWSVSSFTGKVIVRRVDQWPIPTPDPAVPLKEPPAEVKKPSIEPPQREYRTVADDLIEILGERGPMYVSDLAKAAKCCTASVNQAVKKGKIIRTKENYGKVAVIGYADSRSITVRESTAETHTTSKTREIVVSHPVQLLGEVGSGIPDNPPEYAEIAERAIKLLVSTAKPGERMAVDFWDDCPEMADKVIAWRKAKKIAEEMFAQWCGEMNLTHPEDKEAWRDLPRLIHEGIMRSQGIWTCRRQHRDGR